MRRQNEAFLPAVVHCSDTVLPAVDDVVGQKRGSRDPSSCADDTTLCSEENRQREAMRSRQITERLGVTARQLPASGERHGAPSSVCPIGSH